MVEKDYYGVLLMFLSFCGIFCYSFIFIFIMKQKNSTSTFHVLLLNLSLGDSVVLLIFAIFVPVNMFFDVQAFGNLVGKS